jgi:hypothetical protein
MFDKIYTIKKLQKIKHKSEEKDWVFGEERLDFYSKLMSDMWNPQSCKGLLKP